MIHFQSIVLGSQNFSLLNRGIADQPKLLLNSSTECHLLTNAGADWVIQFHFHDVLSIKIITSQTWMTFPGVQVDPTLNFKVSSTTIFVIFNGFLSAPVVIDFFNIENWMSISTKMSGSSPSTPSTLPTILSLRVIAGSIIRPTAISPPGTAQRSGLFSAMSETMRDLMGVYWMLSSESFHMCPGLSSTAMPTCRTPSSKLPPTTPPCRSSMQVPGLLTSKLRMMIILGARVRLRLGTGMSQMDSQTASMLYFCSAEMGMMGELRQMDPFMNYLICLQFSLVFSESLKMMSILFCRIIMRSNFMIYSAIRCSIVWGCGHQTLAAIRSKAASITAAPVSIVERKTSWPGQSQKDMWRSSRRVDSQPLLSHLGSSSLSLGKDLQQSGAGQVGHLNTLALAYPKRMVMFLTLSCLNLTVVTPEMALTTVDLP